MRKSLEDQDGRMGDPSGRYTMILKVKDMEEVGWRGEGRWPTEVKDSSEGRETSTALELISQDGFCTSVLPVTDVNL